MRRAFAALRKAEFSRKGGCLLCGGTGSINVRGRRRACSNNVGGGCSHNARKKAGILDLSSLTPGEVTRLEQVRENTETALNRVEAVLA